MPKVFAIAAFVFKVITVALGALASGDVLPVILISVIFDLALQTRRKVGYTSPRRTTCDRQLLPH